VAGNAGSDAACLDAAFINSFAASRQVRIGAAHGRRLGREKRSDI
jgi:hypothetical protein